MTAPSTTTPRRSGIGAPGRSAFMRRRLRQRLPRRTAVLAFVSLLLTTLAACGQTTYTTEEHLARAADFQARGNVSAAIIEVKNALQQTSSDAEARRLLGMLHLEILDGTTAHAELSRALELGADADTV